MSQNGDKVINKWKQDPDLLVEMGKVLTKATLKVKVNLTQDEKAEVFEKLAKAIKQGAITGL